MKKIIIIMLVLMTVGIALADIIQIQTDLIFNRSGINLEGFHVYENNYTNPYQPIPVTSDMYNHETREITVRDGWIYRIKITGITPIDLGYGEIAESGIDMRYTDYYVIEKYFAIVPGDPGTPINQ